MVLDGGVLVLEVVAVGGRGATHGDIGGEEDGNRWISVGAYTLGDAFSISASAVGTESSHTSARVESAVIPWTRESLSLSLSLLKLVANRFVRTSLLWRSHALLPLLPSSYASTYASSY